MTSLYKYVIILPLVIAMFSCSKEEGEIIPAENQVKSENFDAGHLLIILADAPGVVDSIIYKNQTKGFSHEINQAGLGYLADSNISILSKPFLTGNTGDQIECCVYLNTPSEIGIAFDTTFSTLQTPMIPAGKFCETGAY